ncbi:Low-density lipoprotein receptor- protein 1B [Dermatophagoides pteronyssinus]|uniref:Low-density lipoprotein receptor- protein 1B n=1 Tax=Dermatophagoides pteronyssinus TaxID=6956 RepID=A0ABQ8JDA1_DERPT|nr:Low-density lipoprotein receptor- protein 1B [Dermatophagoides pteronyssinus]
MKSFHHHHHQQQPDFDWTYNNINKFATLLWKNEICNRLLFVLTLFSFIIICRGFSDDAVCSINQFECENSYPIHCIPLSLRCDGYPDCHDKSDEIDCQFACNSTQKCIFAAWRCDGEPDCEDGSDELDCDGLNCEPHQFRCANNNRCIDKKNVCNHFDDCGDDSDESVLACMFHRFVCTKDEFKCLNGHCISRDLLCDGNDDCGDNSDENLSNCTQCSNNEFKCKKYNKCISNDKLCDQLDDCPDGEDESNCNYDQSINDLLIVCQPGEFRCHNNSKCIADYLVCDEKFDCNDNSDELNCTYQCDFSEEFRCHNNGECIPISMYCDGQPDCLDHSDEQDCRFIDQTITNDNNSITACRKGFRWNPRLKRCFDINECIEDYSICSGHQCSNTLGGFECHCSIGFIVINDECVRNSNNHSNQMIFTANNLIQSMQWSSKDFDSAPKISNSSILFDYNQNTGDDNDFESHLIFAYNLNSNYFVASNQQGQLYLDRLDKNRPIGLEKKLTVPVVLAQCQHRIGNLAIDWMNHLIYLINMDLNHIEVIKLFKPNMVMIFVENVQKAQDLEVNPLESWIVWSESNRIVRQSQDGNEQIILTDQVIQPTGLKIDFLTGRIYWLDAGHHSLNSINFDGSDQRIIIQSKRYLENPFDIDLFDNQAFWTDLQTGSIYTANKFGGNSGRVYELFPNKNEHQNVTYIETLDSYKQPRNDSYKCPLNCPYRCDPITAECYCPKPYIICLDKINGDDDRCQLDQCLAINRMTNEMFNLTYCLLLLSLVVFLILCLLYRCFDKIRRYRKESYKTMRLNDLRRSSFAHLGHHHPNHALDSGESSSANLTRNISDASATSDDVVNIDQSKTHDNCYLFINNDRQSSGYCSSSILSDQTVPPYKSSTIINNNDNNEVSYYFSEQPNSQNDQNDEEDEECLSSINPTSSQSSSSRSSDDVNDDDDKPMKKQCQFFV